MTKNLWYKLVAEFGETPIYYNGANTNNGANTMLSETKSEMLKKGKEMCPILYIGCFTLLIADILIYEKWCDENFIDNYILWNDSIYLKSEEDAMAFKLRWL